MKGLGRELLSVTTVLAIPVGIAFVLPYEAFDFHATAHAAERRSSVAFRWLSPEEETRAMRAAKTSWQGDGESARNRRAEIYFAELPAENFPSVMPVRERSQKIESDIVGCGRTPFLPSRRAAPPVRIDPDGKAEDPLPFSREELLKIN